MPGFPLPLLLGLIVAKIAASAISIGSGFRGGLFSTSLLHRQPGRHRLRAGGAHRCPGSTASETAYALIGMGAVAAAIVGAPVTMILLVLEATGDFSVTLGVTVGVVAAGFDPAPDLRLLLQHLALPPARRADPQPP